MDTANKRVLLLFPPLDNIVFLGVFEPLVLEIFSAIAKEEHCEVELVDLRFDKRSLQSLAEQGCSPNLIAIATHGYNGLSCVNDVARECRKNWSDAVVVTGGGQATLTPELFDPDSFDYLVRGPGEDIWRDWCRSLPERRSECEVVTACEIPKVYSYPLPDRAASARYRAHYKCAMGSNRSRRAALITMTQGCPYRCTFCGIWPASLGTYRIRRIEDIITELKTIEEDYVFIGDDNTFANYRFVSDLTEAMQQAGIRKEMVTYCRANHIVKHPELFSKWAEMGLAEMVIGVEAVNDEQLDDFNKDSSIEENLKAIRIMKECGIRPVVHLLISQEWKRRDFDLVYDFVEKHEIETPILVPITPLPGTEFFEECKAAGKVVTDREEFYTFNYNVLRPTHLSMREYDQEYDRLLLRVFSLKRFFKRRTGSIRFGDFFMWTVLIRLYILKLRFARKAIYREAA